MQILSQTILTDDCHIGRGYRISFESPKNEQLSLFKHGERAFDHIIILPPKSKGIP